MLLLGCLLYVRERTAAFLCNVLTLTTFQGHNTLVMTALNHWKVLPG